MGTREQHIFLLSDEKRKVHVDVNADRQKLTATFARSDDELHIFILPKVSDAEERCEAARADISVKWRTSKDEYQETSFSVYNEFSVENPAEWRLRLDGYLPLFEDSYSEDPRCMTFSSITVDPPQALPTSLTAEVTAGIINILVKAVSKKEELRLSVLHPISSGKLKVEEEVLKISKELMAAHSPFFSTLFYGDFKERNMEVVEIKVDLEPFMNIIEFVNNRRWKPKYPEAWEFAMKVADGLEMIEVMKTCEARYNSYCSSSYSSEQQALPHSQPPRYMPTAHVAETGGYAREDERSIRHAFVRKVFTLFTIMLGVVTIINALPYMHDGMRQTVKNDWMEPVAVGALLVFYSVLIYSFPNNLIMTGVLTVATGFFTMVFAQKLSPVLEGILPALIITTVFCAIIAVFSIQTKYDLTSCMGLMIILSLFLMVFGIVTIVAVIQLNFAAFICLLWILLHIFLLVLMTFSLCLFR